MGDQANDGDAFMQALHRGELELCSVASGA